jgi:L-aminoadipate-semialdehyde dehydrogenase
VTENPHFLDNAKDVIPAGKGMKDVQLLVVNRTDRNGLCAVGELGEIYIRSGGLSEGYLDKTASADKFFTNWFASSTPHDTILGTSRPEARYWMGVRDRVYRSGDLGRYLPDGNVECSGRADDQVKIRGFRVELGEIDAVLSKHPSVRENTTVVRKNVHQDTLLVSYFVPIASVSGEVKDIRAYLKRKLPSYAVPSSESTFYNTFSEANYSQ